jgi:hypothetical protein
MYFDVVICSTIQESSMANRILVCARNGLNLQMANRILDCARNGLLTAYYFAPVTD